MARVKANLRRRELMPQVQKEENSSILTFGKLIIDLDRYEARKDDKTIELTYREFELLKFMAQQKTQVFSQRHFLKRYGATNISEMLEQLM